MQVVKQLSRTTGSGHNREVVALYRWPLGQVPLYQDDCLLIAIHVHVVGCLNRVTTKLSSTIIL